MKILIVSSVGGHLNEVMCAAELFKGHEIVLVVNREVYLPDYPFARVYRIAHAERDRRTVTNLFEAARILEAEAPDVILSTGAGPAVPFALVARSLTDARIVFIETAAAVTKPSLTGRLMSHLSHDFFFQWEEQRRFFRRGKLVPLVFG